MIPSWERKIPHGDQRMGSRRCIRECNAKTWQEAGRLLVSFASAEREVYFRGQADASWPLESSFGRLMRKLMKQHQWKEENMQSILDKLERGLLEEFRRAYCRIPNALGLPKDDDDEFVALARHYGLPTRLLDWTRLPYVAAFFAFDGCNTTTVFPPGHKVAVWVLDWDMLELLLYYCLAGEEENVAETKPPDFEEILESIWDSALPRIERMQIRGNPNRRLVYQEGLFTRIIRAEDNIARYLRKRSKYAPGTVLTKITIPGSEQADALRELSFMAITPVALMNDPGGAAMTAVNAVVRFLMPASAVSS